MRLQQILKNLIQNAVKFTQNGYIKVKIAPELPQPSASMIQVRFSVEDTGCGIPLDEQQRIFEPFTQVDASSTRQHGGVGLGLSICQKLLQLMGGRIYVESELQMGSTFWFVTPLESYQIPTPPPQPGAALSTSNRCPDATLHPSTKLLLVEDEPGNQVVLIKLLERLSYRVDTAIDGQEALDKLFSAPYDIVLMDCQMPVMDGYEATQKLRQWEAAQRERQADLTPKIVIGITAHAMAGDREKCLAAGMDDYLSKPVWLEDLQQLLNQWTEVVAE
ncbi:MAG: response regulator [Cyanothece sp. SIO1E1]|nr:response regulator [Cyanothece sp. SIO1E1]